jgi:hypothetical protein
MHSFKFPIIFDLKTFYVMLHYLCFGFTNASVHHFKCQIIFDLIVSPPQFVVFHASLCLIWYQKRKIKATNDWAQVGHGVEFKGLSSDMTEEVSIGGKDRLVAVLEWISRDRTGDF